MEHPPIFRVGKLQDSCIPGMIPVCLRKITLALERCRPSAMTKKRVYLVDDHPIMRQGLGQLINHEPDMEVVGEASDAASGLTGVIESRPDLVIIDISLPGKNGLELIKDIRSHLKSAALLVHSMHDEGLYVERVLRAGAQGYIMKQEGARRVLDAVRKVLNGDIYVSPAMSGKILEIFSGRRPTTQDPVEALSDRQFEIFQMIGQGKGTRAIAGDLKVSVKTVDAHRANIKDKLHLKSGTELVRYAVRWVENQNQNQSLSQSENQSGSENQSENEESE